MTVVTVRDFTQVFDAYAQFEKSMISAKMETTSELGPTEEGERDQYKGCLGCGGGEVFSVGVLDKEGSG